MTLNQLRYFCTASRCHSITKAAEELYVTQPTVSVAIRDLEIEFGISLFYRKGNRLILTEEGEELYNKATYILQYCTELQADYSSMARVKPPLRIGIPPMLSTVFFPELLIAFHDQYPEIAVVLEEYGSVRAAEISAVGKSIYQHDPKGKVAEAYKSLTREVVANADRQRKLSSERAR